MDITNNKLFNKNLTYIFINQVLSNFGVGVLRFSVPLYILYITDNPVIFGVVSGIPFASLVLFSFFGGFLSDKIKKNKIMFWIDLLNFSIILLYVFLLGINGSLIFISLGLLFVINALQAIYSPAVDSGLRMVISSEKLTQANGLISLGVFIANILSPVVAGVLLNLMSLIPILIIGSACFFIAMIFDIFIKMPVLKNKDELSIKSKVSDDFLKTTKFIFKTKPILIKCALIFFLLNMTIRGIMSIGFPIIIIRYLNMDINMVGIAQGIVMIGGLVGSIIAIVMNSKIRVDRIYIILIICGLSIFPIGLKLMLNMNNEILFLFLILGSSIAVCLGQITFVITWTFIQKETPLDILGKVLSLIMILPFLANAMGRFFAGILFNVFESMPWVNIFISTVITLSISAYALNTFKNFAPSREKEMKKWIDNIICPKEKTINNDAYVGKV